MANKQVPEDEIEKKLKDHLKEEAAKHHAPSDLWARLEPKLESPKPEKTSRSIFRRLVSYWEARPIPVMATAVLLMVAITAAWIISASPWQHASIPASQPPQPGLNSHTGYGAATTPAPTATPAPTQAPPWGKVAAPTPTAAAGYNGPSGAAGPQGPAGPAGPAGPGVPSTGGGAIPYPYPTSAPAPTVVPMPPPPMATATPSPFMPPITPPPTDIPTGPSAQRMVIQNGTLSIIVTSTQQTIDRITQVAKNMGGYVVSAQTWQSGNRTAGSISIRVPAEMFPDAMKAIRGAAVDITQDQVSSSDVTGEYVDLSAQLKNLQATEDQLLKIMDKATQISDILSIQRELSDVQGQIEQIKGRMQFLAASSATSLVQVSIQEVGLDVSLAPSTRQAHAGDEITFVARVSGGFAPYSYQWDLGDGTASSEDSPTHAYATAGKFDIAVTVTDDKGNTATVAKKEFITIAAMDVSFGESATEILAGQQVQFKSQVLGGFAPLTYAWTFGDGSASAQRDPAHVYDKAGRYTVALTVTDDNGNVASKSSKELITVDAAPGWDFGKQVSNAIGGLAAVGKALLTGLIWIVFLVPLWGIVIGIIIATVIRLRRSS